MAAHGVDIILRQTFRVRARIGQQLVTIVKRLRDAERVARAEAEAAAGLALQCGEIVKLRRRLLGGLFDFLDDARFARATVHNHRGLGFGPNAFGARLIVVFVLLKILAEPSARVRARQHFKLRVHFPIIARHKIANQPLALAKDRERRCLHAAGARHIKSTVARVERRERARAIESHQPIAFRPAQRRVRQRLHPVVLAQFLERLDNRAVGHRLHPHSLHRFLHAGQRHNVAEDQFPLAARIAGVDNLIDLLALDQAQ